LLLLFAAALYVRGVLAVWGRAGVGHGVRIGHVVAFILGETALIVALVSPLDSLSLSMLSAHMTQHLLLMLVAAPFLVAGRPVVSYLWAMPLGWRRNLGHLWHTRTVRALWSVIAHPGSVLLLSVGILWGWHLPILYQAALNNQLVHSLEHACFLGSSLLLWWTVLHAGEPGGMGHGVAVLYLFIMALPSTLLGVLFLFSRALIYPDYAARANLWHLTPLQDQQLAGLIMWIPPGVIYLAASCYLFIVWLSVMDRRHSPDHDSGSATWVRVGRDMEDGIEAAGLRS